MIRPRRLPQTLGPAPWDMLLGPAPSGPSLDGDQHADFVIVGAGFAGLTAARRLRQLAPKARIVVLEAGHLAQGSAGRNSGFMIDLPHELTSEDYAGAGDDRAVIARNRQAIGFAREAVEAYNIPPAFFDPVGKINAAVSPHAMAQNASYADHLTGLGEAFETLDAVQMQEATGTSHYTGGVFTPGTVLLQPAGYVRGLARGLRAERVDIFENAPVHGLEKTGPDWRVQSGAHQITAPKVILAVNGHLESFGFARGRLMHLFLFGALSPELEAETAKALGGKDRWGITPSDPMGTSVRRISLPDGRARLLVRSCAALRPSMAAQPADLNRATRVMQAKFDARFAPLAGLPLEHVWAGQLCLSLNGVAVAREVQPGLISACVQNGLGTTRGTLTGIAAADRACGLTTNLTRHFETEAPPKRLPPQPFQQIGANAVLRWKEWRARHE